MADAFGKGSDVNGKPPATAPTTLPQGRLRAGQCECMSCPLRFGGTRAFDLHRTGPAADRRCRDAAELVALGLRLTPRGWSTAYSTARSRGERGKRAVAA